jgi:hypothetical protein
MEFRAPILFAMRDRKGVIAEVLLVGDAGGRYAIGTHDYLLMLIANSGPSRLRAGRAKIRSRLDVAGYFLYEHDWENKREGVAMSLCGLSRRDSLE